MQTERNIEQIKASINRIGNTFNWIEIPDSQKIYLTEAIKIGENETTSKLLVRENHLLGARHNFLLMNLRYVKYQCVDNRNKYTNFYNTIRKAYQDAFPIKSGKQQLTDLWQILDLAIKVMEDDLYCCFRGEIDLFWYEKLAIIYDSNEDNYYENVREFISFLGLLDGVNDYRIIGIIEKDYDDGTDFLYSSNSLFDDNEEFFITRDSVPNVRIKYQDKWNEFSNDLIDRVSSKIKDISLLLNSKFTEYELFEFLSIEKMYNESTRKNDSLKVGYSNWYSMHLKLR